MKRQFLKDFGLTDDQINTILDENGKDLENAKSSFADEIAKLKLDISTRDNQLEEVKKSIKSNEDLESKIAALQEKNTADAKAYEDKIRSINIDNAVKESLSKAQAKNHDVVKPLLAEFLSKAEVNEGVVTGLDEEIEKLIGDEKTSFLFDTQENTQPSVELSGVTPIDGKDIESNGFDMKTATYDELVAYQAAHPEINIFNK